MQTVADNYQHKLISAHLSIISTLRTGAGIAMHYVITGCGETLKHGNLYTSLLIMWLIFAQPDYFVLAIYDSII